jgi:hypothetical protein
VFGRRSFGAAALLLVVSIAACAGGSGEPAAERRVFAGAIEGTDVLAAVVVKGDRFCVYACGGDETYHSHSGWVYGRLDDSMRFDRESDGWHAEGMVEADRVNGRLRHESGVEIRLDLALSPAIEGQRSELYAHRLAPGCRAAVVVQEDGHGEPRVQGTFCDGEDRELKQVTPVLPVEFSDRGLEVEIAPGGEPMRVIFEPVLK